MVQKRGQYGNPEDYFAKNFDAYEKGFGQEEKEFWIGLKTLSQLTAKGTWELRVNLLTWTGDKYFAIFHSFKVLEGPRYEARLEDYDEFSTISQTTLQYLNRKAFSTYDKDQDGKDKASCSNSAGRGGWWFDNCYSCNMNGLNRDPGNSSDYQAMKCSIKSVLIYAKETDMKIIKIKK